MNEQYIIIDNRTSEHFKIETFSGFKKKDIMNALFTSIETNKLENACYWVTECIISGYIFDLFEKIIYFSSKIIHINNPTLPSFLLKKYMYLLSITKHIQSKDEYIHLRNAQTIRHLFFDIVTTLCTSSKTKRYDKYPKIKPEIDFNFSQIQNKLIATMNCCPSHILRFSDPEELRIIINEIFYNLKNNHGSYERLCYWISWIFEWEKIQKKKNGSWEIEERNVSDIKDKYKKDIVWLLWEVILDETNSREDSIKQEINSLFKLFKHDYSPGKKNNRKPILYHVLGYLTHPIDFSIPIRKDISLFIHSQCNVNLMFQSKKTNEQTTNIIPLLKKQKPKKKSISQEICDDKLQSFNDLDILFKK